MKVLIINILRSRSTNTTVPLIRPEDFFDEREKLLFREYKENAGVV
jgi:hypothetical protein